MMDADKIARQHYPVFAHIACMGLYMKPTGSRVTASGWTDQSDYDFVVLDREKKLAHFLNSLTSWEPGGSGNGEEFTSFKSTEYGVTLNLILVDSDDVFRKYCAATEIIKTLNTQTREERIKIFDMVFGRTLETKEVPF
jgi:hypothetical protein